MTRRERERRQDQDMYAILVVLGIAGLIMKAANAMYYSGLATAWVPAALAAILCVAMPVYAHVRKVFD